MIKKLLNILSNKIKLIRIPQVRIRIRITPDMIDNIKLEVFWAFMRKYIEHISNLVRKLNLSSGLFKFARYFENYSFINFLYEKAFLYPVPLNLNYLWNFGSLAFLTLMIQIITGILLVCWYLPDVNFAFESVEFIMREVNYGWVFFFCFSKVLYLYMGQLKRFSRYSLEVEFKCFTLIMSK